MQLQDLFKPLEDKSDEELMELLRKSRHNRKTARPAAKSHAKRAENKEVRGEVSKIEKLIKQLGLTKEQVEKLLSGEG